MINVVDPWLEITLEISHDRFWITGRRFDSPTRRIRAAQKNIDWYGDRWLLPVDLRDWLAGIADTLEDEEGPHYTGPRTLPIFLGFGSDPLFEDPDFQVGFLGCVEHLFFDQLGMDPSRFSVVLTPRKRIVPRQPFKLPIKVVGYGTMSETALGHIGDAGWYDDLVPAYGLTLNVLEVALTKRAGCEIFVCDDELLETLDVVGAWKHRLLPRLLVVLNRGERAGAWMSRDQRLRRFRNGMTTIWSDAGFALDTEFVRRLIESVIHDYSIHQSFEGAMRRSFDNWNVHKYRPDISSTFDSPADITAAIGQIREIGLNRPALVVSDRVGNQSLRLRDAALALYEHSMNTADQYDLAGIDDLLDKLAPLGRKLVSTTMRNTAKSASELLRSFAQGYDVKFADFTQETVGLAPRAGALRRMKGALHAREQVEELVGDVLSSDENRAEAAKVQERRVDLRLLRLQPRTGESFIVGRDETLAAGSSYRLRVSVGRLGEDTLVVGDSPPIDTLLPDPAKKTGHLLTIVVDPLDFALHGRVAKTLELPPLGPSKPITFDVDAPKREGLARLRVLVYLERNPDEYNEGSSPVRNHLVQTLQLQAKVTEAGSWDNEDVTTARVEYSRTLRFSNLGSFGRRALSIAFNTNASNQSHSLTMKVGTELCNLSLSEAQMSTALKEVRNILKKAAFFDPDRLERPRLIDGQSLEQRQAVFDETIRALVENGATYWSGLFLSKMRRKPALLGLVKHLIGASDETIQIVPIESDLFPWAMIYDAPRPASAALVCHGYLRKDQGGQALTARACLDTCLYADRSNVHCIYGFWGMRMRIDQSIGGAPRDATTEIFPARDKAVHVSVGLPKGPALQLADMLAVELGQQRIRNLTDTDDLIDLLWNDRERPAVLVIVGHAEPTQSPATQQPVSRITLPGQNRWLHPKDLFNRLQKELTFFTDPSPIVVLAACDSAAADLSTFVDFIQAFDGAGAAAIVGVEIPILQQHAARLGKRLTLGLFQSESLAQAILSYRRELLLENNPLGFVVTSFGDARLAPGQDTSARSD